MNLLSYRAFSTELLKIAQDLGDAEIRALMAERRGEEYLKGGELDSRPINDELPQDGNLKKNANVATVGSPRLLRARRKDDSAYQTVRDTGVKTLGGAFAGAGATKLLHDMAGKSPTAHKYRMGAGIGAGLAIADRVYRHRDQKQKTAFVQQNPGAPFKSPGDELASTQNVGKFQNRIHQSAAKIPSLTGKPFTSHTL